MSREFEGVRIYAVVPARDIRAYLERHAQDDREPDAEASLDACEAAIKETLQRVYPGAMILVRRQDQPTPEPPRTRVESSASDVDAGAIEQEIIDLISEFDITECVVYKG